MNHDRTYRPVPYVPAPCLRDADSHMRPAITTEPCRPAACAGVHPCCTVAFPATDHYSLLAAHWTYTFSAKEKDSETGLSYFGSRYYSSDLSIWLSVDPMASKYPSLSPYTYCADNPVKLVDPDGEKVLPTSAFQNSAYNKVYQNLSQTNNTYKQILSKYQDDTHE